MAKSGRPRKWTYMDLNHVKALMAYRSASKVAEIMGTTKNAVLGALYREKVKNGYVPPLDSKYTVPKIRSQFKGNPALGERKCNVCDKTFTRAGRFDLFCDECRRLGRVT